jgi:hypothetical protein
MANPNAAATLPREVWHQVQDTRKCPRCGGRVMFSGRMIGAMDHEELRCGCGFAVWYEYRLTETGRMVSMGAGYLAAPLSDGTLPQLRTDERWGTRS